MHRMAGTAEAADYGVLRGVFAPTVLLRLPLLHRYVAFLRANGVRVSSEAAACGAASEASAEATPPSAAEAAAEGDAAHNAAHGAAEGDAAHGAAHGVVDAASAAAAAHEAAAAEEAELSDELHRVRSDARADATLEQPALQLVLCVAARAGACALAEAALRLGGDPAPRPAKKLRGGLAVNEHGLPPLHIAAREGCVPMVRLLLAASAPPTLLSGAGLPPLHVAAGSEACRERATDVIELLLAAGAPLAMRDERRQTALHAAARGGSIEPLCRLLRAALADDEAKAADPRPLQREPAIELRDRWHRTASRRRAANPRAPNTRQTRVRARRSRVFRRGPARAAAGALRRSLESPEAKASSEPRTVPCRSCAPRLHWAVVNQQQEALALLIAAGASVSGVPMSARKHKK